MSMNWLAVTWLPTNWCTSLGALWATLAMPQRTLLFIYGPSAVGKLVLGTKVMQPLWPTLPTWIWPATAAWEALALALTVLAPHAVAGWTMLYAFMGGVLSSLVYIPDQDGYTHVSGKGPLGRAGWLPLLPAVGSTVLLYLADTSPLGLWWSCSCVTLGFGIGVWIYQSSRKKIEG